MPMSELAKLLDERSSRAHDADDTIKTWQADVEALCGFVEAALEPLRAAGRLKIDYRIDDTTEEHLGTYNTKGIGLRFTGVPGATKLRAKSALVVGVRLPNGAWTTGVQGRVDLAYGAIRLPIVRNRTEKRTWSIGLEDQLRELDEASLERALQIVMGL